MHKFIVFWNHQWSYIKTKLWLSKISCWNPTTILQLPNINSVGLEAVVQNFSDFRSLRANFFSLNSTFCVAVCKGTSFQIRTLLREEILNSSLTSTYDKEDLEYLSSLTVVQAVQYIKGNSPLIWVSAFFIHDFPNLDLTRHPLIASRSPLTHILLFLLL